MIGGAEVEDDEEIGEFPRDSDGSAKVALVGVDRSIGAWGELHIELPDIYEALQPSFCI